MAETLPSGWIETTLGEVCLPVATVWPEMTPNAEFTYFDIGGIDGDSNRIVNTKIVTGRKASSRARQVVKVNDILFATVRTYLKKIARVDREYANPVASTGFAVVRAAPGISPEFLFFQILSDKFLQPLNALQSGSSYPAVREKDVFAQPILIPPTAEQKQIVKKLKASLLRVARGEDKAHQAEAKLQDFRASLLRDATTGHLTSGWRNMHKPREDGASLLERLLEVRRIFWEQTESERMRSTARAQDDKWKAFYRAPIEPEMENFLPVPDQWAWVSPDQLSDGSRHSLSIGPFGSNLKVSDYRETGVPLVFVRNVRSENFSSGTSRFVSQEKADELGAHQASGGDLLITKMGDPPGDACVYPLTAPDAVITADCIRLRLSHLLKETRCFFVHCINSSIGKDQIRKITRGVAQQKINLLHFSAIALPLPPVAEQIEIIQRVEQSLLAADKLAAAISAQLARARIDKQSLLRDAFAGKLVPQEPDSEHASSLLDSIRRVRQAETKKLTSEKSKRRRLPKLKTIKSLAELLELLDALGGSSNPEPLLLSTGLGDDVDVFFDLLREGKATGVLTIPTGESGAIQRRKNED